MNKTANAGMLTAVLFFGLCFSVVAGEKIRVVSLSPNFTELIFHLGKGDCLVGRSSACDFPPEAAKIPVAGKFGAPSMETLASLRPDYVVSSAIIDAALKKNIESFGVKILLLHGETIDDYYMAAFEIGKMLGCSDEAEKETQRVRNAISNAKKKTEAVPFNERPKVYLEIWNNPLMTVGKKSFINDLIGIAGGVNIAGNEDLGYIKCSEEWIILSNPDVIISPAMGSFAGSEIAGRRGWEAVPAVKNKRIYTGIDESLLYRLGPRMIESIEIFRRCFYPEKIGGKSDSAKK